MEQYHVKRDILIVVLILAVFATVSMYRDGVFDPPKPAEQVNELTSEGGDSVVESVLTDLYVCIKQEYPGSTAEVR